MRLRRDPDRLPRRAVERVRERFAHVDEEGWFFAAIAEQVVDQRRARGLSQRELAELTDTTQSAIARLESGGRPPRIDTLLRIAHALDCELVVQLRPRTRITKEERTDDESR
jgi:transcriptional regulator with XRE-family HTH domain